MEPLIDFEIHAAGAISGTCINRGLHTFSAAARFIKALPYGRNADKLNLSTVFTDNCGTCSTKHALLKLLATENGFKDLQLTMGLFRMNGRNTPKVATRLLQNGLEYIPEAHCYLKYGNEIMDFTKYNASPADFVNDLMEEVAITPAQITDFKVDYHKNYLKQWLTENAAVNLTLEQLWKIREACIQDLSA
ncbi:hypothetical protein F0919_03145 [Taibaiella lutea]|uniref:Uncharacterized protein n=1 Tax=Taibaiella lutea TaxID=2608001 RepID=A0A5M6CRU1_9BACT|nr:hypothetical protein [Taibaiella lutea]KAA5536682.1 hypothetical protein F0919_03145 [Taibaiella lutea]